MVFQAIKVNVSIRDRVLDLRMFNKREFTQAFSQSHTIILPNHVLKLGEMDIDPEKLNVQLLQAFEDLERVQKKEKIKLLMKAYELSGQNQAEAARLLNIPRTSYVNKCKALGIQELMDSSISREEENETGLKSAIKKSWTVVTASLGS